MLSFLKNHPFAVEAFFESSIVLTFALPKENLQQLIPACLSLDTFEDKWAFIAVALVQTKDLRPKGFPKIFGNDFFLIGFRVFVRYKTISGKNLRGLFILRSETDKRRMEFFGNIFTHYNYSTTDITRTTDELITTISSKTSNLKIDIDMDSTEVFLPQGSLFKSWKEARRYAGPLPFTFTYNAATKKVLIIEGVRKNWEPKPLRVISHNIAFLDSLGLSEPKLANAFIINNVPYYWKKGKVEKWKE